MPEAVIVSAVRTPIGRAGKGALKVVRGDDLGAVAVRAAVERAKVDPAIIEDVIIGCAFPEGEQGMNVARIITALAGLSVNAGGVTVNRFCASSLQAVNMAAQAIILGLGDVMVAGGVESMSRVPMGADGAGIDGNNLTLRRKHFQVPQGISADLIATLEGFTRADLDRFALTSQQRAAQARADGRFTRSLFPVVDPTTGLIALETDEYPRPDTTLEGLAALEPAFAALGAMPVGFDGETMDQLALARYPEAGGAIQHVHTAGNSSGIVDGAAAVLLASADYVAAHGLAPRARIRALATLGAEPLIMLTAPAPTARKALALAGMTVHDIDLWEINEAFATVPLQVMRALELDPERVNVNGGAIALGHPLGATGAMLLGTVLDELERRDLTTALITLCIGGGQGIATIIERV